MNLQRTILRMLDSRPKGKLPTGTLWADTAQAEPGISYSEFKRALTALEQEEQVVITTGQDGNKAFITDAGRARLMES